ncbi:MAG TPA: DUF3098 domain-containing protein [Porphyromonadaceae bacterium]|mgnify:FL=1|nr:DUF3098 domain-containing protein [Porphyromonadaceae bacterium]
MSQKNVALKKVNWIICGIAVIIIIAGFILMAIGPSTTAEAGFQPDIFSARRIKMAPVICVIGFVLMVVGILYPSKTKKDQQAED